MNYKTKVLIIKTRNFLEADKILIALDENGAKVQFVGKGARRPLAKMAGYLNLFNYLNLVIAEGKNLDIVTSAENITNFKNLETDLEKTGVAFLIAELLDKLLEEKEKHYNLQKLTLCSYSWLNKSNKDQSRKIISFFLINILEKIGLLPELYKCINCNQNLSLKGLWFDFEKGGVICDKCQDQKQSGKEISEKEVKIIRLYLEIEKRISVGNLKRLDILKKIDNNLDKRINETLLKFIEYNTDRTFKSSEFLIKIKNL